MNPDPFDRLLSAVFDPSKARPSGRLRPLVVGRPHPVAGSGSCCFRLRGCCSPVSCLLKPAVHAAGPPWLPAEGAAPDDPEGSPPTAAAHDVGEGAGCCWGHCPPVGTLWGCCSATINCDSYDLILAAVFDPSKPRPSRRLRPLVVGRPHPLMRLPRRRRAGLLLSPSRDTITAGLDSRHPALRPGSLTLAV